MCRPCSLLAALVAALGDASNGDVPLSALDQQVMVMNQLMTNTPFTFVNAGVTRISNVSVRPIFVNRDASRPQDAHRRPGTHLASEASLNNGNLANFRVRRSGTHERKTFAS